jgi:hypothetical protein
LGRLFAVLDQPASFAREQLLLLAQQVGPVGGGGDALE